MAKHTKRRAPRAPFIITVTAATSAMALAVMPGCGTVVEAEESTSGSTGGNPAACPAEFPPYQSACTEPGLECTYPSDGCPPVTVACESGTWQVQAEVSCNPPPPDCPMEKPEHGSPCTEYGAACFYPFDSPCGPNEYEAYCNGGTWEITYSICNPPAPVDCETITTEADCVANSSECRWLVPGCANPTVPPLEQAGCFTKVDCDSDVACGEGKTCQGRIYDPCYNLACEACAATAMLCLAP